MKANQICPICGKPYEYDEYTIRKEAYNFFRKKNYRKDIVVRLPKCQHYDVEQAARVFLMSEATLRRLCRQGGIGPALKIGGKWYIRYDLILKRSEDFQPEAEDGYYPNDGFFDGGDRKAGRDFWSNNSMSDREFAEMNEYLFTDYNQ